MLKVEEITRNAEKAKEFFENKLAFTLGPVELKSLMDTRSSDINIIDVRNPENYNQAHIPMAISVPGHLLESSLEKLSKDKINIVYCYDQQCHLAAKASLILAENGFPVMELEGGFHSWKNKDYDMVSSF